MHQDLVFQNNDEKLRLTLDLFRCGRLPETFQLWLAELARDLLRLGVYFRAAGFMLCVPGGAGYRWPGYERFKDPGDEFTHHCQKEIIFDLLAACLERLGAEDLFGRIPGAAEYEPCELCPAQAAFVERKAHEENGLLSVVARCLDELIVQPGMKEIDAMAATPWWQHWRMEEE